MNTNQRYKIYLENKAINLKYNESSITTISNEIIDDLLPYNNNDGQKKVEIIQGNHLEYLYKLQSTGIANVGVLNNANMYFAGGGYIFGQIAQEESLCYVSNLHSELLKMRKYYLYSWLKFNLYNSNSIFYSKDICVYRDENLNLLEQPITVDIVSASAVNRKFMLWKNENKINSIMKERIKNILKTFILQGNKVVILNPFGCGAYGNDLNTVAIIFKELLFEENLIDYFDEVIFICFKENEYQKFKSILNR